MLLNGIGFGNIKQLKLGDKIINTGLITITVGLVTIVFGLKLKLRHGLPQLLTIIHK